MATTTQQPVGQAIETWQERHAAIERELDELRELVKRLRLDLGDVDTSARPTLVLVAADHERGE